MSTSKQRQQARAIVDSGTGQTYREALILVMEADASSMRERFDVAFREQRIEHERRGAAAAWQAAWGLGWRDLGWARESTAWWLGSAGRHRVAVAAAAGSAFYRRWHSQEWRRSMGCVRMARRDCRPLP